MNKSFSLILKLVAAVIMLQTLFFKFTAAPESVALFTKIAGTQEATIRIFTGILELIASILLFVPNRVWMGALLTIGLMSGAILSHITIIGITHNNDNGVLFISAIITLVCAVLLLFKNKKQIPFYHFS